MNPGFWWMIRDVRNLWDGVRLSKEDGLPVGGLIERLGAGSHFRMPTHAVRRDLVDPTERS
jgi:hypothetical protein